MEKFKLILESIDWVFAAVILLGGRYFGSKYFRLVKKESVNFLAFATAFGLLYLAILHFTEGIYKNQVVNLFITYLVVTSFYEVIAQGLFEFIESKLPWVKKKEIPVEEAVKKYEAATGEKVVETKDDK